MTHTYAELPVSPAAHAEIKAALITAGYGHAIEGGVIDMHDLALVVDAAQPAPAVVGSVAEASITLDFKQATELLEMFGGEPAEITLQNGDGHSGKGVYAHYTDMPEEGAEFLGLSDNEAAPESQPHQIAADHSLWCRYVAEMVGAYIGEPVESERIAAIAGIIERRLWALPDAKPHQIAAPAVVEPVWHHAECNDPDRSGFYLAKSDAQTQVNDHGGYVTELFAGPLPHLIAEPASQTLDADLWYLQDTRSFIGNDVVWWAKDGKGYTTDVSKAHVYNREDAFRQAAARGVDRPWPKAYIDLKTRPAVDMQYIDHAIATKEPS